MEPSGNHKGAIGRIQATHFDIHRRSYLSLSALSAALVFGMSSAAEAACWKDILESRNGNSLAMRSGAVYRVLDDPATASFWLPLSRLIICDQLVVNVNGEMATIYEIRNQDDNEVVKAALER